MFRIVRDIVYMVTNICEEVKHKRAFNYEIT
jgi:hypothetical protein